MYQQTSEILKQQKRHVTSTPSKNCHSKKVLLYFAYILSAIILLLIVIICYYYTKQRYNIKWKTMNLNKFKLKIVRVIISMI